MDLCHLKNAELVKHLQQYKGRVVLRGDNVKDEEGYRAVFADHGASASQVAAAKFLDTTSKLLGMGVETCDAISAYTEVKMTEAPRLLRMPKEDCPEIWIRILRDRGVKVGIILKIPRLKPVWSPIGQPSLERKCEEVFFVQDEEKYQHGKCLGRAQRVRVILVCVCGWWRVVGKKRNMGSVRKTTAERNRP